MSYQPCIGQLYLVKTRGEYKRDGTIEKCTLILQAGSRNDVEPKIRYHFDVSKYATFAITRIARIDHVHTVSAKLIPVGDLEALPDVFRLECPEDSTGSPGAQRTNQGQGWQFAFGIAGHLNAHDRDHALKRIGTWLLRMALGEEVESPLHGGGILQCEQEGVIDSTVTTASQLRRMDATHFKPQKPLPGGLPSLGR